MSIPHLPAELLDHVVDHLHDAEDALRNCCLVSKSWIPRTRKHLFADISFSTIKDLKLWKNAFPDPSTSPAQLTRSISIYSCHVLEDADADGGGWLRPFSHVVHFRVALHDDESISTIPLVSFHGFSPAIKSLDLSFIVLPPSHIFDLILSFSLLENLSVICYQWSIRSDDGLDGLPTVVQPSSPPKLTGTLGFHLMGGMDLVTRRLLALPGGIHFRKLTWTWFHEGDLPLIMRLVEECSQTFETLRVTYSLHVESVSASINLSKATKLRDVVFHPRSQNVDWILMALQTITPNHRDLRRITIYVPNCSSLFMVDTDSRRTITEAMRVQWLDLDLLLVRLWESHSIRPRVIRAVPKMIGGMGDYIGRLLPELTKTGVINPTKL